jgi:hypothetical protein
MKMRGVALGFGIAAVVALSVACGSAPQAGDDDVFTVQVARVNADKSVTIISEHQITRAQEIQENEARKNGTLPVRGRDSAGLSIDSVNTDSNCAGSDNWLYDQTGDQGNRLCLYGTNPTTCAAMNTFPHPGGGNWQNRVASFYTGSETGYFECGDLFCPSSGSWAAYTDYSPGCATCSYTICFTD